MARVVAATGPGHREEEPMSETGYSQPISRRDAWLTVALAVARDGLPTPESLHIYEYGAVVIDCLTHADADAWAAHLDLHQEPDLTSSDGKRLIRRWDSEPGRNGYLWMIRANAPVDPPSPLAAEVVAAILTPDAASLPVSA